MSASPEKNYEIGMLLDIYGALLTDRQRDVCELYYDDDLSLSEVAEECGISRQGVRDALMKSEAQLRRCETALGLFAKGQERKAAADALSALIAHLEKSAQPTDGNKNDLEQMKLLVSRLS